MGDSINNFIDLLIRGDFFLIFLIIMMVVIIGVIVYLVRLQIHDTEYYDRDEDSEDDEDYDDYELSEKDLKSFEEPIIEESIEVSKPSITTATYSNLKEEIEEELEDIEEENPIIDDEEELEEDDHTYDNLERPVPVMIKQEDSVRHVEQSRFDFDNEEVVNSIKDFEDEQEATAIISATELENRINELKASGEYEEHERQLQEYEKEQETKAIISYEELLKRASTGRISYESEENMDGIHVAKVDTSNIEHYSETNDKPYYKEEAFLEAMKEFRRAL